MDRNILLRLERRCGGRAHIVALTVAPGLHRQGQLVCHVHAVVVVDDTIAARPTVTIPVSFDASLKHYMIGSPPFQEDQLAEFFLHYAEGLLTN